MMTAIQHISDRACESCRKRRVKCDKAIPTCQRCHRRGDTCPGYAVRRTFFDQSEKIRNRVNTVGPARASIESIDDTVPRSRARLPAANEHPPRNDPSPSPVAARLLDWGPNPPGLRHDSQNLTSPFPANDDYFDLDIDTYYANGNNACGFIPGLPVILSDVNNPNFDTISETFSSSSQPIWTEQPGSPMLERRKETALLTRLFVDAIAPGMDLFDFDAYFSRIIPLKAANSLLLQSALAAVAAKFVAQTLLVTPNIAHFNTLTTIMDIIPGTSLQEWFYKAASYYDKGISSLRIYLHRWTHKMPQTPLSEPAIRSSPQPQEPVVNPCFHKKRRLNTIKSATNDVEDLLSAISVLSLYETLDNPETGYLQHLNGFRALLEDSRPNAVSPNRYIESSSFAPKTGARAAFWLFARADVMSSSLKQKATILDPENIDLFRAAGLPVVVRASSSPQGPNRDFKVQILPNGHREDIVACAIIWLALRVVNFVSQTGVQTPASGTTAVTSPANPGTNGTQQQPVEASRSIWNNLQNLVNDWYETLPMTFEPYAVMDLDEDVAVTPKLQRLFFSVPTSAAALLLYHFTQLLLLFNQPIDVESPGVLRLKQHRKLSKEVDFHSRQICGIALGDPSIAVQRQIISPLCLACMSLETEEEKSIMIQLLRDIGTRTSIPTEHLVQGLQSGWA